MHRRYQYFYLLSSLFLFIAGFILMANATPDFPHSGEMPVQAGFGATLVILSIVVMSIGVVAEIVIRFFQRIPK